MSEEVGAKGGPSSALSIVRIPCPVCGVVERHRVVHVRPSRKGGSKRLEGIARCSRCRTSHPFTLEPPVRARVRVIVSEGPVSARHHLSLPKDRRLAVGEPLTVEGRPVVIRRLEGPQDRSLTSGFPRDVVSVWAVPTDQAHVRLSLLRGAKVTPLHLLLPPDQELRVGGIISLGEEQVMIVGLRGRGHTFHDSGTVLRASEVQRAYVRRAETPPGGRRAWTRSRVMPRS
jgi:uncharacterized Zn finger protein